MKSWLITWNESNWKWKNYESICKQTENGETVIESWTFANTHVQPGDRVYLIKLGHEPKGIIASGFAKTGIYKTQSYDLTNKKEANHIDVEFDRILNYKSDNILEQSKLKEIFSNQEWSPQSSGIAIKNDCIEELEKEWINLTINKQKGIIMNFSWVTFYEELADKILEYKNNRSLLVDKIRKVHDNAGKKLPKIESNNDNIPDIDPFTVFALFNRGNLNDENRKDLCKGYKQVFNISADVPTGFDGIPVQNYVQYCFYKYVGDPKRNENCFDELWNLFEQAIIYSSNKNNLKEFIESFDNTLKLDLVGLSKLTIALFQIRPNTFINIDSRMVTYFKNHLVNFKDINGGEDYLKFNQYISENSLSLFNCHSYAELSHIAFLESNKSDQDNSVRENIRKIIELYKNDFDRINEDEIYKWKAIGHYKKVWDINAPDFAKMVTDAFSQADNLLTASMYYAYSMLKEFAINDPEQLRSSFKNLYNEDLNLEDRIKNFISKYESIAALDKKSSFQNLHTISVYLLLNILKSTIYSKVRYIKISEILLGIKKQLKTIQAAINYAIIPIYSI